MALKPSSLINLKMHFKLTFFFENGNSWWHSYVDIGISSMTIEEKIHYSSIYQIFFLQQQNQQEITPHHL